MPSLDVRIKWPNDLYLDGLKVGGILCTSTYKSRKFNVSAGKYSSFDRQTCEQTSPPYIFLLYALFHFCRNPFSVKTELLVVNVSDSKQ